MAFLDENGLAVLWSQIKERSARVATGSYVGTGTYNKSPYNSLTFDFTPKVVFVKSGSGSYIIDAYIWGQPFWVTRAEAMSVAGCNVSVSGNTMTWYSTKNEYTQLNDSSITYQYVAIG